MALPTQSDLKTMDFASQGQPFVKLSAKSNIDLLTGDFAFQGQPFIANSGDAIGEVLNIEAVLGIDVSGIIKIGGVTLSAINKIGNVER